MYCILRKRERERERGTERQICCINCKFCVKRLIRTKKRNRSNYPGFADDVYCRAYNAHNGDQGHPPAHQVSVHVILGTIVHPCVVHPGKHHDNLKIHYTMQFGSARCNHNFLSNAEVEHSTGFYSPTTSTIEVMIHFLFPVLKG